MMCSFRCLCERERLGELGGRPGKERGCVKKSSSSLLLLLKWRERKREGGCKKVVFRETLTSRFRRAGGGEQEDLGWLALVMGVN